LVEALALLLQVRPRAAEVDVSALAGEPDLVVTATLSKSVGAAGGVVAGPRALIGHLVDTSRPFVYDTALPPSVVAGALTGVELLRSASADRSRVQLHAGLAALTLREAGLEVAEPAAAIVSVTAPDAPTAAAWASACLERGVAVGCFRPPSTPDTRSRLRLTTSASVPTADFRHALRVIVETAP
jgi:8-amino-7-oxononanoate synthase